MGKKGIRVVLTAFLLGTGLGHAVPGHAPVSQPASTPAFTLVAPESNATVGKKGGSGGNCVDGRGAGDISGNCRRPR